jgi:Uncharacterized conserved protein
MTIDEVLGIAQTIEENGANFYRRATGLHFEERAKIILLNLAEMEEEHKREFSVMQAELPKQKQKEDVDLSEMGPYLKALSDSSDLEGSNTASHLFTGDEALSDIVLIGIDLEKETILYYLGLKDLFSSGKEKKIIDNIINQEKVHLVTLVEEYRKLRKEEY